MLIRLAGLSFCKRLSLGRRSYLPKKFHVKQWGTLVAFPFYSFSFSFDALFLRPLRATSLMHLTVLALFVDVFSVY